MKKFLNKILLFLTPVILLIMVFVIADPFLVLWEYDDYSGHSVQVNREMVSYRMFDKNYMNKNYNAFILGSSRSVAFKTLEWSKYLPVGVTPFSFDASNETIVGMGAKLKYILKKGLKITSILMIIDSDATFNIRNPYNKTHLVVQFPASSLTSWYEFYLVHLKAFFQNFFFIKYLDFTVFKTYRGWHEGIILKDRVYFDKSGNSILLVGLEDRLKRDESKYYYELNRINLFHKKKHANKLLAQINSESENILSEIAQIINSKKIEMRIVISPLYDQIAMNQDDIDKLKQYFGKSNVYDYSGDSTITNDYHNYYERSHYRPFIGNKIMRRVYEQ